MRKILIGLFMFLLLSVKTYSDDEIVNIPDPYFKDLLIHYYLYADPPIDLNKDGEIQYSEAAAFDGDLWLSFEWEHIKDITGIKAFINVKRIRLEDCPGITEIDLSGMVNLQEIIFNYDKNLEVLNISGCKNLGFLDCEESKLRKLDAKNCFKLHTIICLNNPMEEIDLTECRNLGALTSTNGKLSKLDIHDCTRIEGMILFNNQLSEIDLSQLTNLKGINCNNNQLKKLDVSNSTTFVRLKAYDNQLESLNVRNGNNKAMTDFKTYGNPKLKCITVDDPAYSIENWKEIDEWTKFSEDCSTSINESEISTFKIFPNPANNSVLIERMNMETEDLRILDITGRIYIGYAIPYGESQIRLDVSRLSAGAYVIEINNDTQSLIIE